MEADGFWDRFGDAAAGQVSLDDRAAWITRLHPYPLGYPLKGGVSLCALPAVFGQKLGSQHGGRSAHQALVFQGVPDGVVAAASVAMKEQTAIVTV